MNNTIFAEKDGHFIAACENVGIPATKRQASKWRMKKGRAWQGNKKKK